MLASYWMLSLAGTPLCHIHDVTEMAFVSIVSKRLDVWTTRTAHLLCTLNQHHAIWDMQRLYCLKSLKNSEAANGSSERLLILLD